MQFYMIICKICQYLNLINVYNTTTKQGLVLIYNQWTAGHLLWSNSMNNTTIDATQISFVL